MCPSGHASWRERWSARVFGTLLFGDNYAGMLGSPLFGNNYMQVCWVNCPCGIEYAWVTRWGSVCVIGAPHGREWCQWVHLYLETTMQVYWVPCSCGIEEAWAPRVRTVCVMGTPHGWEWCNSVHTEECSLQIYPPHHYAGVLGAPSMFDWRGLGAMGTICVMTTPHGWEWCHSIHTRECPL